MFAAYTANETAISRPTASARRQAARRGKNASRDDIERQHVELDANFSSAA